MNYLFDTNILLYFIKKDSLADKIRLDYNPFGPGNIAMISIVTQGEILSICYQRGWSEQRKATLLALLSQFLVIPIEAKDIVEAYAEIDAFSQGKIVKKPLPDAMTSRNMGKNDLWIAATAFVTKSKLFTTDHDFDHLHNQFFEVINPSE